MHQQNKRKTDNIRNELPDVISHYCTVWFITPTVDGFRQHIGLGIIN